MILEECRARLDAGYRHLFAYRAVSMMLGVTRALLGAHCAGAHARLEQSAHGLLVPLGRTRERACGGVTDIGAGVIERNAGVQRGDVLLNEICIRARGASLDAGKAGVDRPWQVSPRRPLAATARPPTCARCSSCTYHRDLPGLEQQHDGLNQYVPPIKGSDAP